MLEEAARSLAGGVSSPFRAKFPVPLFLEDGCGCRVRDVDGNEYIDYTLAWGPNILGHRHPRLSAAMQRAAAGPLIYGAQHRAEREVAERVCALVPCAERVAFTSSGSEAVQLAMRLARAATGRPKILKFEGHYHGWMDSALISHHPRPEQVGPAEAPAAVPESRGQAANALENVVVARWNDAAALEARLTGEVAAVIMEPVLCNSGCILPQPGYLETARELCTRSGALLIFDEVITGFRIGLGGAQAHYGVTPDIATFGKALGGGVPLSAVAARKDIMDLMFGSGVAFGGTFNGNPISLAGAAATLEELTREDGAALARANRNGARLRDGLAQLLRDRGVPAVVCGFGTAFAVHFTGRAALREYRDLFDDDSARLARFIRALLDEGVYVLPDGRWYTSAVHTEDDIARTLAAAASALAVA